MNFRKAVCFIVISSMLVLGCGPAAAGVSEDAGGLLNAENTYLFQLTEEGIAAVAAGELSVSAEPVYAPVGLYKTEELSLVLELDGQGYLDFYEQNGYVHMIDPDLPECEPLRQSFSLDLSSTDPNLQKAQWGKEMLGAQYAAEQGITGKHADGETRVRIGIIDSGLSSLFASHSNAEILEGCNYIEAEGTAERTNTSDTVGHGTYVASMIADSGIGLAPEVSLVPLKCFDNQNGTEETYDMLTEAIYEAVDKFQCDIINLSLGTTKSVEAIQLAVAHALEQGVYIVAAVGNVGTAGHALLYPANYDGVIGVGSLDASKKIASSSVKNGSVDVAAPGANVYGLSLYGQYKMISGTSFATPLVAAAAALALSVDPDLTPAEFADLLTTTAEDLGTEGYDTSYGYGLMNTGLLLAALKGDSQSLITSTWNGNTAISLYQAAPPASEAAPEEPSPAPQTVWNSFFTGYDEDGRMSSLTFHELETEPVYLCNYQLPEDQVCWKWITLDTETWAPVGEARMYEQN